MRESIGQSLLLYILERKHKSASSIIHTGEKTKVSFINYTGEKAMANLHFNSIALRNRVNTEEKA